MAELCAPLSSFGGTGLVENLGSSLSLFGSRAQTMRVLLLLAAVAAGMYVRHDANHDANATASVYTGCRGRAVFDHRQKRFLTDSDPLTRSQNRVILTPPQPSN